MVELINGQRYEKIFNMEIILPLNDFSALTILFSVLNMQKTAEAPEKNLDAREKTAEAPEKILDAREITAEAESAGVHHRQPCRQQGRALFLSSKKKTGDALNPFPLSASKN